MNNFEDVLQAASKNTGKSQNRSSLLFNNVLPPPKKIQKSAVTSEGVLKFLQKKKQEEEARAVEARLKKEQLLAIRATNSKNNKKAKIMASRTKDNDFSRIKLTEDEVESKKKIQQALQLKHLANKVERMKARIELEEKEKMLPKKRKRKSKTEGHEAPDNHVEEPPEPIQESKSDKHSGKKVARPPPPAMNFSDLLKIAAEKQYEPVNIPVKKKDDGKLLTKKERRQMIEEQERMKRQQERIKRGEGIPKAPPPTPFKIPNNNKKLPSNPKSSSNSKPVVIHVEKNSAKPDVPKAPNGIPRTAIPKITDKNKPPIGKMPKPSSSSQVSYTNHEREKVVKTIKPSEQEIRNASKGDGRPVGRPVPPGMKKIIPKKNGLKIAPAAPPPPPAPVIDPAAIYANLEKKMEEKMLQQMLEQRERMEKEFQEKMMAKLAAFQPPKEKTRPPNGGHVSSGPPKNLKKLPPYGGQQRNERPVIRKPPIGSERPSTSRPKAFHPNPYLDPPRRRLDPICPQKPIKRRIESDDDDDDDDDMDDFIDDSIDNQNEDNYSKYIKEIFHYDKDKYLDDDDDDIVETNFADQMKEETRSAKLGYMEDLEEERKLREQEKKRKMKLKK